MSSNPAPIDKAAVDVANSTTTNNNMAPITATTNSDGKDGDIPQDGTVVSIGLEADEDELSYLGGHGAEDDDDGDGYEFDGMVITSEEIGESSITARLSLAHFGTHNSLPAALLVFSFSLLPARGSTRRHRFKSATITLRFHALDSSSSSAITAAPHILAIHPNEAYGAPSAEEISRTYALGASLGSSFLGGVGTATLEPRVETSRQFTRHRRTKVRGAMLGAPRATRVRWNLEENEVEKAGIPMRFETAVLVRHEVRFGVEVAVKTSVGLLGLDPRRVWPLKGRPGKMRVVDPGRSIGTPGADARRLDMSLDRVDLAPFTSFPLFPDESTGGDDEVFRGR